MAIYGHYDKESNSYGWYGKKWKQTDNSYFYGQRKFNIYRTEIDIERNTVTVHYYDGFIRNVTDVRVKMIEKSSCAIYFISNDKILFDLYVSGVSKRLAEALPSNLIMVKNGGIRL